ncbi:MAG: hypothetical protein V4550_01945 [Gemmatimonadota bacterium]
MTAHVVIRATDIATRVTGVSVFCSKSRTKISAHATPFALDVRAARVNIRLVDTTTSSLVSWLSDPTRRRSYSMMMAHDSSQIPPSRLNAETVDALRAALRQYLSNGLSPSPLQLALFRVASEAREKSMLPEQLLIVLKDIWNALPEVRAMSDPADQVRLLQRVVTMCIKEYYST